MPLFAEYAQGNLGGSWARTYYPRVEFDGWADQGVLLINSVLTVEANRPASHRNKGWEQFTDIVLKG